MKKGTKVTLIIAAMLIGAGLILAGCGAGMMHFSIHNIKELVNGNGLINEMITEEYTISDSFESIYINSDTADIKITEGAVDAATVTVKKQENYSSEVRVNEDTHTLSVILKDNRAWYEKIGIFLGTQEVEIILPAEEYKEISVEDATGDINIKNIIIIDKMDIEVTTGCVHLEAVDSPIIELSVTTGDIRLEGVESTSVELDVTTGDISMKNVNADNINTVVTTGEIKMHKINAADISVSAITGEIQLTESDGENIVISAVTGDIDAELLTGKQFDARAITGEVKIPASSGEGRCSVSTTTGDITVTVSGMR